MAKTGNYAVGPTHQDIPIFGNIWYVDGTNGATDNDGNSFSEAMSTVQLAVTAQGSGTDSLGDVIYVLPGAYTESVTGNLAKVQVIGVTGGGTPHATSIRPATSYSWTGTMTDAAFRNIMFLTPNSSSKELPALMPTYMGYSIIDNCKFIGRDIACVEALQIGTTADDSTVVKCDFSEITNNVISTFYGHGASFEYGIKIGYTSSGANSEYKQMHHSLIAGNTILAETGGIWIGCSTGKVGGTVIRNNHINGFETGNGPDYGIWGAAHGDWMRNIQLCENIINANTDGIYGFYRACTFSNYISLDGAAVSAEAPAHA